MRLTLNDDATFSNYYPGVNLSVIKLLENFAVLQGESFIFLWGSVGVGRTHLLQACCHVNSQSAMYLDLAEPALQPEILTELECFPIICLDNLDYLPLNPQWELALFHFFNRVKEHASYLLISAEQSPSSLFVQLPDLFSRLNGGLTLHLQTLPDEQKIIALQLRAKNRGLNLSEKVSKYILSHYDRNMKDLLQALETLDCETLRAKRRLTVPFVKKILEDGTDLAKKITKVI
ncbi:MAG: DnaA regulatory inactivator Hda [Proteobacteria bacterium]|nr:DnaA regulatory inactivator Hda [Pseudomonadota bacterium]